MQELLQSPGFPPKWTMVVFLGANSADVEIPPSKSHRVQYLQGEAPVGWFIHPVYNMYLTIVMALALPVRHQNHILTRTKRCIDSDNSDQASMPGHRLRAWPYDPLFAHHCPSHERALMRRNNSLSVGFFCALLCMNFGILPSPNFSIFPTPQKPLPYLVLVIRFLYLKGRRWYSPLRKGIARLPSSWRQEISAASRSLRRRAFSQLVWLWKHYHQWPAGSEV